MLYIIRNTYSLVIHQMIGLNAEKNFNLLFYAKIEHILLIKPNTMIAKLG